MPYQDFNIGMNKAPLAGNPHIGRGTGASPVRDWVYKGDTKGRKHYQNMDMKTALKGENPIGKKFPYWGTNPNYEGYNSAYTGKDKTGGLSYTKQGLSSLIGVNNPDSNVGGGTQGSKWAYEKGLRGALALTPAGRVANVGHLAYEGTNAVIDQFGFRDNLKSAGSKIHNLVAKYMPSS